MKGHASNGMSNGSVLTHMIKAPCKCETEGPDHIKMGRFILASLLATGSLYSCYCCIQGKLYPVLSYALTNDPSVTKPRCM